MAVVLVVQVMAEGGDFSFFLPQDQGNGPILFPYVQGLVVPKKRLHLFRPSGRCYVNVLWRNPQVVVPDTPPDYIGFKARFFQSF